jgi:hypothetical protein
MAGGKCCKLELAGLDQLLIAITQSGAPQAGHAFNIWFAGCILDMGSFPRFDDQRAGIAEGGQIGMRMDERLDISCKRIGADRHDRPTLTALFEGQALLHRGEMRGSDRLGVCSH